MDLQQTTELWAQKTIEIWFDRMSALGVHNASQHAASFGHHIHTASGGDPSKIEFTFQYFLKFTDMGVGRGVTVSGRSQANTRRIKKQWYNKTFLLEARKLASILSVYYCRKAAVTITDAIKQ